MERPRQIGSENKNLSLETQIADLGLSETFPITDTKEFPAGERGFLSKNRDGLAFLVLGVMADVATTALVLGNEYGTEENSLPSYLVNNFGVLSGQAMLKSAMFSAYTLATRAVSPILDKIFKTNNSAEKVLYFGGYTQFGISGLNLLSYMGVNI